MTITSFLIAIFAGILAAFRPVGARAWGARMMVVRVLDPNKTTINRSGLNISSER